MARYPTPLDMWSQAAQLGMVMAEAQAVIAMRMLGSMGLWSVTPAENSRMVSEKVSAMGQSMQAATQAMLSGARPDQITAAAIKPIRRKTRANARRLGKRGPKIG